MQGPDVLLPDLPLSSLPPSLRPSLSRYVSVPLTIYLILLFLSISQILPMFLSLSSFISHASSLALSVSLPLSFFSHNSLSLFPFNSRFLLLPPLSLTPTEEWHMCVDCFKLK
jgi:hypothetical protein